MDTARAKLVQTLFFLFVTISSDGIAVALGTAFFGRELSCGSRPAPASNNKHHGAAASSSLCDGPNSSKMQMKLRVGIVGLPNVGKSTLFNALAQKSIAQAANFPFCTIDPNMSPVAVPSAFLQTLGHLEQQSNSNVVRENIVPATMQFVDVAGLAKNAHRGEGLGNRFLASLRECTALVHLIRVFPESGGGGGASDEDIIHVHGKVDPVSDAVDINLELLFADMEHVERRLAKTTCQGIERETLTRIQTALRDDVPARSIDLSTEEEHSIRSMGLLTQKPVLYAFNVDEIDFTMARSETETRIVQLMEDIPYCDAAVDRHTIVCAKMEASISTSDTAAERDEYLVDLGIESAEDVDVFTRQLSYNVLPDMVREMLGYGMVYTGLGVPIERSKTVKAHLIRDGMTADDLAGRIHQKIQEGFLRAETIAADEMVRFHSFVDAKDAGVVRSEGRDYCLQHEDVVLIKWKGG